MYFDYSGMFPEPCLIPGCEKDIENCGHLESAVVIKSGDQEYIGILTNIIDGQPTIDENCGFSKGTFSSVKLESEVK